MGLPLGAATIDRFPDGEGRVQIEENVRGTDVFVVQSTCAPVDENLMQLLIMIDALHRASAGRVTALIPYFGYGRQEKKTRGREPITAKLVANLLEAAGVARVLTMDLHAPAIQGFFDIPVDHLEAVPLLVGAIRAIAPDHPVVVSPDSGGVARADAFRSRLDGASLAIVFKDRTSPDSIQHLEIVGEVEGRTAIIVDDLISTANTLVEASRALLERGAKSAYACAAHPVLAGDAVATLTSSPIEQVFVTDTIPLPDAARGSRVTAVDTSALFAEAVRRIHNDESVTALFE